MKKNDEDEFTQEIALVFLASVVLAAVAAYAAFAGPTFVWSLLRLDPTLLDPGDAVSGALRWATHGTPDPREMRVFAPYREVMPPPRAWIAMLAMGALGTAALIVVGLARVDRWRGSRSVALPWWSLRNRVTPRSWAKPRDVLHLQPRDGGRHRIARALTRLVASDRRAPAPPGGDSWPLGTLRGHTLRSAGESHLMAVAPTRAGKTTRVLIPALLEHEGPAIVLLNKTDALLETLASRARHGPVWIYAPLHGEVTAAAGRVCGWTPLAGCESWEYALRMGRWFLDADPSASTTSSDSGGARFYNREATANALPPLLHAAALHGRTMSSIHRWLRSGIEGLDEPRAILSARSAAAAADSIAGLQALDERPRSLLLMSAAQLVDAYRFPSVQAADRVDFEAEDLLEGGTLYIVAPTAIRSCSRP